jgi:hypothetical protein
MFLELFLELLPEGTDLLLFPVVVLVGFYVIGRHALPMRFAMAVFGIGTAVLAFLAYRLYQSEQTPNCGASPEVAMGGDTFSCLDAGNRAANALAELFLLLMELGLATMVAGGLVRWWKERRIASG